VLPIGHPLRDNHLGHGRGWKIGGVPYQEASGTVGPERRGETSATDPNTFFPPCGTITVFCFPRSTPRSVRDMIRLIAAIDSRRGIATDSGIPWKLPGDTAYFRDKTSTGVILMGRATYNEFAAPLHRGTNFVLSTKLGPLRTGFQEVGSLDQLRGTHPDEDIWVIGGAAVYAETITEADELLLTQVVGDFHCTKFFPSYRAEFGLTVHSHDYSETGVTYRFETWRRRESDQKSPD